MPKTKIIEGVLQRVTFNNPESGWSVITLATQQRGPVTAVGILLGIRPGEALRLTGRFERNPKFGEQFKVESYLTIEPSTQAGVERYLGSGLIPGLGPKMARRLVAHFGDETLNVIEKTPKRLSEAPGVGPVLQARIRDAWSEQHAVKDVMIFLQGHGVSPGIAARIWKVFGAQAVQVLREDPYQLAEAVSGIGFLTADRIASEVGIARDAPARLEAGILHVLHRAAEDGHTFLPAIELRARAARLLGVEVAALEAPLAALVASERARERETPDTRAIFLRAIEDAEATLAARIRTLAARPAPPLAIDLAQALARYEKQARITLAKAQRQAITRAVRDRLLVITGGPGTGKTTLVRGIVSTLEASRLRIQLAAPTGRAAKRLAEATGRPAKTIHRLLEFDPRKRCFLRDHQTPLSLDLLVIDEASMLDTLLAQSLLEAIPDHARLVLVGDVDQLPSVGPGRVLADIITSGTVAVVRLETIFRQAHTSLIVESAHRVRGGALPVLGADGAQGDFFFIGREAPEGALATVLELVTERIPRRFGFDPMDDIQVLTPMQRGLLGAANLNHDLQARLNPHAASLRRGNRVLRVGDRVMQLRNNYDLDVFNGDVGRIDAIDEPHRELLVTVDGRTVRYPFANLEQLSLAYACSIHKAQGSEFPCVVVPIHTQHFIMLERNLLYTAITRGKRLVVVVGSRRALRRAVERQTALKRHTLLAQRLDGNGL